jgi:hypothetical protein
MAQPEQRALRLIHAQTTRALGLRNLERDGIVLSPEDLEDYLTQRVRASNQFFHEAMGYHRRQLQSEAMQESHNESTDSE